MDLSESWAPEVTQREVEEEGSLLDEKYDPYPGADIKNKVVCKLYYLKHKDLFVTISDGMTDSYSAIPLHVITSDFVIQKLKHKYFKEEIRAPIRDAFMEYDDTEYVGFQSEIDLSTPDSIKKHGQLIERLSTHDVYYIESVDRFGLISADDESWHTFDSPDHRKKYGIPYQDERFN
jgi:hypothetical protein